MTEIESGKSREMPHTHVYHILLPVLFIFVWMLDTTFLKISTFINVIVPLFIRISLSIGFFILAFYLQIQAHKTLFSNNRPSGTLITTGILAYIRNPMYLGIFLIYVAMLSLSISLLAFGVAVIAFLIYNKMVNFEEKELEKLFGQDFLDYKKKVPKWIPKLRI